MISRRHALKCMAHFYNQLQDATCLFHLLLSNTLHTLFEYGWPALSWPSEAFSEGGSAGSTNKSILYVLLSE
jgi:hypothetical protein